MRFVMTRTAEGDALASVLVERGCVIGGRGQVVLVNSIYPFTEMSLSVFVDGWREGYRAASLAYQDADCERVVE